MATWTADIALVGSRGLVSERAGRRAGGGRAGAEGRGVWSGVDLPEAFQLES